MLPKVFEELEVKLVHHDPTFKLINGVHALKIEHSVFSVMTGLIVEILFMLFFSCNVV